LGGYPCSPRRRAACRRPPRSGDLGRVRVGPEGEGTGNDAVTLGPRHDTGGMPGAGMPDPGRTESAPRLPPE
jgi:hypothetical protein